jgi:hypothetical protein
VAEEVVTAENVVFVAKFALELSFQAGITTPSHGDGSSWQQGITGKICMVGESNRFET